MLGCWFLYYNNCIHTNQQIPLGVSILSLSSAVHISHVIRYYSVPIESNTIRVS